MKKIFSFFVLTWLSLALVFPAHAANKWMNLSTSFIDGDAVLFNDIDTNINNYVLEPLNRLLINERAGMALVYSSASAITVTAGSVVCSNSAGTINEIRRNTSNTSVSFSDIDTGPEASSTTYYVYANCDADATTATFKVSASGTAPTGVTYFKKLGSFYNDSSSNIDQNKIYAEPYGAPFTDSSGINLNGLIAVYDYGSSASSSTRKNPSSIFMAYGTTGTLTWGTCSSITNLPFSSASSYRAIATTLDNSGQNSCGISSQTASSMSVCVVSVPAGSNVNAACNWTAVGY